MYSVVSFVVSFRSVLSVVLFLLLFAAAAASCFSSVVMCLSPYANKINDSYKLVYRRYAGLYFTIACDVTDNEVGTAVCRLDFSWQSVY